MSDKFVTIAEYTLGCDGQAHLAKMKLDSYGINSVILGENLLGASPYTGFKVIELQVLEEEAEKAKVILESMEKSEEQ
ncbi:MAG: putative signal transducing protein [Planctomycetota bacterium]|jgi:hypothetical protein